MVGRHNQQFYEVAPEEMAGQRHHMTGHIGIDHGHQQMPVGHVGCDRSPPLSITRLHHRVEGAEGGNVFDLSRPGHH